MMRKPASVKVARGARKGSSASLSAPVKGWNARDPEAAMKPEYALVLENFFPETADVTTRGGAQDWVTGFAGRVRSLLAYNGQSSEKLFAATDAGIFDATASGAVPASSIACTNGLFQYTNFTTAAGHYIIAVNGTDDLLRYDGTSWTSVDATAITGITATSQFVGVNSHKQRLWFVERASMNAWYLPTVSIAGAAVKFPLGAVFKRGGYLMAMATWTIDGGAGSDDFAVFISSEGEFAVYQGTDPASASTWALVGVYFIGKPLGRRCFIKYGGDLLFLTQVGVFPASKALQNATVERSAAVTDRIDKAFNLAAEAYKANSGWNATVFQAHNALLVNVPLVEAGTSEQYVMNTLTGAWCRFKGWDAYCFEIHNGRLFFGGLTKVAEAWVGRADFGTNITFNAKQAFSYFGQRSEQKHFKLVRPMLKVDGEASVSMGIDTDFANDPLSSQVSFSPGGLARWDAANWDEASWADDFAVRSQWRTVPAKEGYCAALRLRIVTKSVTVGWSATDFIWERGGML